jgi:GntR family transcriptional regulator
MSTRPVNRNAAALARHPGPRYTALARLVAGEIEAGRYRVGEKIPTEAELQQRFDVSRHTVREALRELKSEGVLSARAGIGTVVRARSASRRLVLGVGTVQELIQFAEATRTRLLDRREVIADAVLARKLGCKPGQQWERATVLRYLPEGSEPVAMLSIFVRPENAGVLALLERARRPIFALLERHHGVRLAEVKQQIVPIALDKAAARALHARAGDLALEITRHYFDGQDRVAMVSVGHYPSDRFSHDTTFRIRSEQPEETAA